MDYTELYNEYQRAIEQQDILINSYERKLKTAEKKKDFKDIQKFRKSLLTFYTERSELLERLSGLKEYIN